MAKFLLLVEKRRLRRKPRKEFNFDKEFPLYFEDSQFKKPN